MAACVVVPAYREAAVIGAVVEALRRVEPWVVVVDDGSDDGTGETARAAGAEVLRHAINRGQGAALATGMRHALERGAEAVVTFDADGQHRPEDLPALLAPLREGAADVSLGSRFLGSTVGMPAARGLLLRLAIAAHRLLTGMPLTDIHNGLRALSRGAAEQLELTMDRMAHASELIDRVAQLRLRWVEVPVTVHYTDYSRAKGQRGRDALVVLAEYLLGSALHPLERR